MAKLEKPDLLKAVEERGDVFRSEVVPLDHCGRGRPELARVLYDEPLGKGSHEITPCRLDKDSRIKRQHLEELRLVRFTRINLIRPAPVWDCLLNRLGAFDEYACRAAQARKNDDWRTENPGYNDSFPFSLPLSLERCGSKNPSLRVSCVGVPVE